MSGINQESPNTVLVTETGGVTVLVGTDVGSAAIFEDPDIAYVSSNGNDSTGDGSPGAPFLTFQAAIDDSQNFSSFSFGDGSFGNGDFTARVGALTIRLVGRGNSTLGDITADQAVTAHVNNITASSITTSGSAGATPGGAGTNAQSIIVYGDSTSAINTLNAVGGAGGAGTGIVAGGAGGDGNDVSVYGSVIITDINVSGGAGGSDGGAGPGAAGSDGVVFLLGSPIVNTLTPDAASVAGAVVGGTFYTNTYP